MTKAEELEKEKSLVKEYLDSLTRLEEIDKRLWELTAEKDRLILSSRTVGKKLQNKSNYRFYPIDEKYCLFFNFGEDGNGTIQIYGGANIYS